MKNTKTITWEEHFAQVIFDYFFKKGLRMSKLDYNWIKDCLDAMVIMKSKQSNPDSEKEV